MSSIISVQNLGKEYVIGTRDASHDSLREAIAAGVRAPFERRKNKGREADVGKRVWALHDINFEVQEGEVLGIIGHNGAGKSTLLKILSRITEPTTGRIELHGRVASLLEVGTGFHPDLTGRENIFLNGAILGMGKNEIKRNFDEIVAFAEVEKFIETPVKRYSSGMYLRLAFAVAAHLEPEILIVDEVLAVGDANFQKKCLGKMNQVAREGRTVLFVSHNLQAISTLTQRTLFLSGGGLKFDGDTFSALNEYRSVWGAVKEAEFTANEKATGVTGVRVFTSEENQVHRFGRPLRLEFDITFAEKPVSGALSFQILDENEKPIVHLWLFDSQQQWSRQGRVTLCCEIPTPRLYMGSYSLSVFLTDRASDEQIETLTGICPFEVVMDGIPREYEWVRGTCTYLEDGKWLVS